MKDVSIWLAFAAGFLSFLSPCVLPLVPAYITYLTGTDLNNIKKSRTKLFTLYKALGFVLGFSLIFILMGLSFTSLGKLFIKNKDIFTKLSGIIIIVFGLHTTGIFKLKFLYFEKKLFKFADSTKSISSFVMGIAFAAGWTPCIGQILSSILLYAGNMETVGKGTLLLLFYSLGLAVPFLLTALVLDSVSIYIRKSSKFMPVISWVSGLLLIIVGLLIFTENFSSLSRYFNFYKGI